MKIKSVVRRNAYYDSVTLMAISKKIEEIYVEEAIFFHFNLYHTDSRFLGVSPLLSKYNKD